ncbi:hypothetical protein TRAPUB_6537 [Trametes pubescens]|uniref:Uncharacterized protein n=1 Tax=Trametes pubescens TaxID=154538 RepID=A0A1M2W720_TRAPU|nr:hypothetical protein TRAPUB_6537 [Trametes pubescens]
MLRVPLRAAHHGYVARGAVYLNTGYMLGLRWRELASVGPPVMPCLSAELMRITLQKKVRGEEFLGATDAIHSDWGFGLGELDE